MKKLLAALVLQFALTVPAVAAELIDDLMAIEKGLWTAWGKKDGEPFRKALDVKAVEIVAGTAPLVGRDAIVKAITTQSCELRSFKFDDAELHRLGRDAVAVAYTATQDASCEGKKLPPKLRATSIYLKKQGRWMQRYYQETPVE
jgi:hypothetical protein